MPRIKLVYEHDENEMLLKMIACFIAGYEAHAEYRTLDSVLSNKEDLRKLIHYHIED